MAAKNQYSVVEVGTGKSEHGSNEDSTLSARTEHIRKHRQYWRDMIFGVNDGLISTFLLVAGVYVSGLSL
jgi:hypothetical protein